MRTLHKKKKLKSIPSYLVYGSSFNVCDRFNRALHHKKWPHKFGENCEKGEIGQQHGFAVAVTAEDIFNLYHYLSASFQYFSLKSADDIATYDNALPSNGYSF